MTARLVLAGACDSYVSCVHCVACVALDENQAVFACKTSNNGR